MPGSAPGAARRTPGGATVGGTLTARPARGGSSRTSHGSRRSVSVVGQPSCRASGCASSFATVTGRPPGVLRGVSCSFSGAETGRQARRLPARGHKPATRPLTARMSGLDRWSDAALLARTGEEPEAFGVFYRRHADRLLGCLAGRTADADLAADLMAEAFAAAYVAAHRYRKSDGQ